MKNITLLALVFITMAACKSNPKNENKTVTKKENALKEKNSMLQTGCYEYNNNGNFINMEIKEVKENVKGNLDIAYAEKDANHGRFIGTVKDDKLIINYTFNSEGTESSREMAFLIKDNQLIEGYGELNESGAKFKDKKNIQYNSSMPLTKMACDRDH